ncbi:MAG TPA: cytochrome C biogenesis protein [Gammaproteobacteria bacterium]|nr:cytochrome C biogenesis protein [Gammaproteobacteria bacterium]
MEYKDYYEVMGVAREATQDEIKRAYRKLARKYHPDVSKESDAEERFKALGEAYEVLKDPEKRAAYDQLGANWQGGQDFNTPPDWDAGFEFSGGGFTGGDATDYSDFFESLFGQAHAQGGGRRGGFQARGQDRHAKILVDLEDSFKGATRAISLQVPELTPDGHVTTRTRTLNIKIPKGIREGQKIRLTGQGDPGQGKAPAGDLYLEIDFRPHALYRAEAHDLYLDLPVAPWEAVLGATVKVPTPEGVVELKVPAGSAQGRKMRLKGRGIPAKQAGDLYVVLQIALPEADTEQAKKLYRQMQDELDFNPRSRMGVEA